MRVAGQETRAATERFLERFVGYTTMRTLRSGYKLLYDTSDILPVYTIVH